MDTIFWELLNRSIAAGWLILAVMALRLLLRKAPKWLPCALWAIVAIRLICPFSLESAFSLIPSAETVNPAVVRYVELPSVDSGIPAVNEVLNPVVGEALAPAPGDSANPLYIGGLVAGIVWAFGLTVMSGYAFISCLRMRARVREAALLRENIWVCDSVGSPFILGIVRPRIYLSSGMEAEQQRYVIAHERAHLKRRDHFWKPFGYVLLAVYWFHPLMWAAYLMFCRDIEFACDEKAVRDMDLDGRKAYCRALLACSMPGKMMVSYPLAFGEGRIKERVKNVLHYRKPALWAAMAAVCVCVVTAVCFLTDPERNVVDVPMEEETANDGDWQIMTEGETLPAFGELVSISRAGDSPDLQAMFRDFGIMIQLPGNNNWIQDREYRQPDEDHMEICYHDAVLDADCKLLAVRGGAPELPDIVCDASLEETWEGAAVSGQMVYVRVQCSADGKEVLATWEYEEYQFAIYAEIPLEGMDIGAVPKTALGVISNLE
ncbi:MAG: M56 family metallopeptidase [Lachnospiraceae bacterium]|nr:M56 family metallopeptidase [Lachnospiraceae bacterium]